MNATFFPRNPGQDLPGVGELGKVFGMGEARHLDQRKANLRAAVNLLDFHGGGDELWAVLLPVATETLAEQGFLGEILGHGSLSQETLEQRH